jgi:hypothetical protein
MRTVVLSTPTSATGSLWRIIEALAPRDIKKVPFIDDCIQRGIGFDQIQQQTLPEEGCFLFNQPHLFNFDQDLSSTNFIVNFRDPRDLSCNQFHWLFMHDRPDLSEEERQRAIDQGIDDFVLSLNHKPLYRSHRIFNERVRQSSKSVITSYVQLCFEVPTVIERIANLFGCCDTKLMEALIERERPSGLPSNPAWIGRKWSGADIDPGRARIELKPETFELITAKYRSELDLLSNLDEPKYRLFYE